jgi:integrase
MRKIWYVGKRHGKVAFNPFERMGLKGLENRIVLWEPAQVEKLIETADKHGAGSIGTLALLCYDLCQRPSDMRKLRWSDLRDGVIRFNQEKTGIKVEIPASERLQARLAGLDQTTDTIIICEATQRPYDRRLYGKWFQRIRQLAELPEHLQLRDLRRTGATEMAESDCTEDELRSVTGHQSRDVLGIYVRPTVKLAAAGINKRFAKAKDV